MLTERKTATNTKTANISRTNMTITETKNKKTSEKTTANTKNTDRTEQSDLAALMLKDISDVI